MKEKNLQIVTQILNQKERRRRINKGKLQYHHLLLTWVIMLNFKIAAIINNKPHNSKCQTCKMKYINKCNNLIHNNSSNLLLSNSNYNNN
jgi:hypothetical protein